MECYLISCPSPTFPQFPKLSPELRRIIWKLGLSRREVEANSSELEDVADDGHGIHCTASANNLKPPAITLVCREAAQVTHAVGGVVRIGAKGVMSSVWLYPTRDLFVHQNSPQYHCINRDWRTNLNLFIEDIEDHGFGLSIDS